MVPNSNEEKELSGGRRKEKGGSGTITIPNDKSKTLTSRANNSHTVSPETFSSSLRGSQVTTSSSSKLESSSIEQSSRQTTRENNSYLPQQSNYVSSLVNKSSNLLNSLKQQYISLTGQAASSGGSPQRGANMQPPFSETNNNNLVGNNTNQRQQQQQQQRQPPDSIAGHRLASCTSLNNISSSNNSSIDANYNSNTARPSLNETNTSIASKRDTTAVGERQLSDSSWRSHGSFATRSASDALSSANTTPTALTSPSTSAATIVTPANGSGSGSSLSRQQQPLVSQSHSLQQQQQHQSLKPKPKPSLPPPLPPPPPREVVQTASSVGALNLQRNNSQQQQQQQQQHYVALSGSQSAGPQTATSSGGTRRHALQEQSLERDAAISLKARDHKHKRTSSIKSALRHAHLGPLRSSASKRLASEKLASKLESQVKSDPSELFEPPVTQRTLQRSKRRGAMMSSDSRRQMSVDTIGLRQLTDEYLHNAGVKPMSSSGQCSMVALAGPTQSTLTSASSSQVVVNPFSFEANQPKNNMENKLYQTGKHVLSCPGSKEGSIGSQDSLSYVLVLPGNLPYQTDVSIQCELLQAPPLMEQDGYETTGDILNTIAGPFRGSNLALAQQQACSNSSSHIEMGGPGNQLSATLRRGLSALSQHHLTPASGSSGNSSSNNNNSGIVGNSNSLNVVGNLKKSISNTIDIGLNQARTSAVAHLHSQDSLPAYSNLLNEPDSPPSEREASDLEAGGLIGHLASKLTRQSSKKFSVSRKGLQRALSFDCRGYKRLDGQRSNDSSNSVSNTRYLLTTAKSRAHNKSTLGLNVDQSPRPYLPQSASQVDFQVPLLPYHKMQEAIVSQRLLEPHHAQGGSQQTQTTTDSQLEEAKQQQQQQQRTLDADELLCARVVEDPTGPINIVEPQRFMSGGQEFALKRTPTRKQAPPKLILDIPTIATSIPDDSTTKSLTNNTNTKAKKGFCNEHPATIRQSKYDYDNSRKEFGVSNREEEEEEEEVCTKSEEDEEKNTVIVCLPSPNVIAIESSFNNLSKSPSFCIESGTNQCSIGNQSLNENQLTAGDVFSRSKNFIKRPSTMVASDAMNQVAQALKLSNEQAGVLKNRRQAIVPPKLATDGSDGESNRGEEARTGQLVDLLDDDDDDCDANSNDQCDVNGRKYTNVEQCRGQTTRHDEMLNANESSTRPLGRKRSGGEPERRDREQVSERDQVQQQQQQRPRRLSGTNLPTFYIEPDRANGELARQSPDPRRPDSQLTNVDSLVSSGSSTNISLRKNPIHIQSGNKRDFTVTSPGGLTVSFGSSRGRRRSSIAVIPQMQICPGDLLVYSKQLIDRMNQSDEPEPPQFLTIDDKKGKNIWSSLKLCAQFDNRTMKARNELLCSLEDVLASLQPSTFVDEQLSHYKGMVWDEFLYETESRRSASSDGLSMGEEEKRQSVPRTTGDLNEKGIKQNQMQVQKNEPYEHSRSGSVKLASSPAHEGIKVCMSTGIQGVEPSPSHRSRDHARALTSRFKEKPKLKRGQTVDSVFRIPLIPSSPLKHAQQHQQTPTAHLEDHNLVTIEDDERSSPSATSQASQDEINLNRRNRSSSTRSRSGSNQVKTTNRLTTSDKNSTNQSKDPDSSFETDDAMDLILETSPKSQHDKLTRTPNQMVRQSSLSTLSSTITRTEQKRQRALWDLFQSECTFFFDHLMTLKNVYMEPLKKIQVEGFAMFADPDVLFGNLDELCCGVYDFCKEFLYIIMRTLKTRPDELNATDVLIKLYKKNPKIDHLRGVYHRYTLNYINALTYLESLRRQIEFVEFEKWSSRDVRCKKLQLTDLLVAPVQHIMRVPIILKDIESHTEHLRDRDEIRAILAVEEASLRELDDKMRWLKNFERLLEIQKNINWPSVMELDAKLFIPDFLKEVLSKQPCEKLIVSPRRQIVHEGTLNNLDSQGKACDMHVILFDDMLLLTRKKKGLAKKASTVCKTNSGGNSIKEEVPFKYVVYKQPLSLDRLYAHDVQQIDSQAIGIKHLFMLIVMNRFQQITNVHSFSAPNDDIKQTWLFKIKKTCDRWKKNFSNNPPDQQQDIPANLTPEPYTHLPTVACQQSQQTNRLTKMTDSTNANTRQSTNIESTLNRSQKMERSKSSNLNQARSQQATDRSNSNPQRIELIVTSASGHSNESVNNSSATSTA